MDPGLLTGGLVVALLLELTMLRRLRAITRQLDSLDLEVQALRVRVRVFTDLQFSEQEPAGAGDRGTAGPVGRGTPGLGEMHGAVRPESAGLGGTWAAGPVGTEGLIRPEATGPVGMQAAGVLATQPARLVATQSAGLVGTPRAGLVAAEGLVGPEATGLSRADSAGARGRAPDLNALHRQQA